MKEIFEHERGEGKTYTAMSVLHLNTDRYIFRVEDHHGMTIHGLTPEELRELRNALDEALKDE